MSTCVNHGNRNATHTASMPTDAPPYRTETPLCAECAPRVETIGFTVTEVKSETVHVLDLERPVRIRRIFDALNDEPRRTLHLAEIFGEDRIGRVLAAHGQIETRAHPIGWTLWDTASALYDLFGSEMVS